MKHIVESVGKYTRKLNKYWVAAIIFVVATFFVGNHNIYQRFKYDSEIKQLKKDIALYRELNEKDQQEIEMLKTDNETLEKYAREELLMVKPGEEVFIIKE